MKFKLEPVLSLRENVEQVKKKELGIASTRKQELEGYKEQLITQKDSVFELSRANMSHKIDAGVLKHLRDYAGHIQTAIQKVDGDIVQAESVVIQKKKELAEAMKQRKILEKLKELKKEQYEKEQIEKQALLLDELVSYKYAAKIQ